MRIDTLIDAHSDMRTDMLIDMHASMRVNVHAGMHVDICVFCVDAPTEQAAGSSS